MSEKQISRRDFLKGTAASAVGIAIGGAVAGKGLSSMTSHAESVSTYIPGVYSGSAEGLNGAVTVTMTFDEEAITEVVVDASQETPEIGGAAAETLADQLLEAQSAEIDGVSGASITSNAVKQAAEQCIAQARGQEVAAAAAGTAANATASGDSSFILKDLLPEDVNASSVVLDEVTDFADEIDCDIVVCGAGAAGVVAAVTAAEEGKKVCLLQKESVVVSQGNCASSIVKSESTELGMKKWIHECTAFNAWRSKPDLLQAYVDNSEEALNWVCEKGGITEETEYANEETGVSVYQDTSTVFTGVCTDGTNTYDYGDEKVTIYAPWFGPKPNNVGTLMSGILDDAVKEYGDMLDVHFSTPVVQLLQDEDGSVTGCVGKNENGEYIRFNAKAVILATGAYENNPTMARRFCPDIDGFDKKVYHRTGDGNILAVKAGGCIEPVAHSKVMHDFDAGLMYDEPFLELNMNGERFTNEDIEMAYMGNLLRWQPSFVGENMDEDNAEGSKGWYCQIYDNDYMEYAKDPVPEVVMQRYLKEEDPSLHEGVFEYLIDTFRADTIEELAEKLGLPVEATVASVERYNELCDAGEDEDFGKKAEYMNKIQTAPFWGIRRHIRCSSICAGVLTDAKSRVITEEGDVIFGLYAVGNLGGQFFGGADYPFFQTGLSLGHAFTFGRIAAKDACTL